MKRLLVLNTVMDGGEDSSSGWNGFVRWNSVFEGKVSLPISRSRLGAPETCPRSYEARAIRVPVTTPIPPSTSKTTSEGQKVPLTTPQSGSSSRSYVALIVPSVKAKSQV